MTWVRYIFKPSSLITILLVLIFIILGVVSSKHPNVNDKFYEIISSAIKILSGALAGAVAGERYVERGSIK